MSHGRERVTYCGSHQQLTPASLTDHPHLDNTSPIVRSLEWPVNTPFFSPLIESRQAKQDLCDAGRKRAAPEDATSARPSKTTKTSTGKAKGRTGPKVVLSFSYNSRYLLLAFKGQSERENVQVSSSSTLHQHHTHTAPCCREVGRRGPRGISGPGLRCCFITRT
jgi:hypothetical protein